MPANLRSIALLLIAGILTVGTGLAGCVGSYTPEESAARTATVAAVLVPTAAPTLDATPAPTPEPESMSTAVPVSDSDSDTEVIAVGTQVGQLPPDFALADVAG